MFWDKQYETTNKTWGDAPSELAVIAAKKIMEFFPRGKSLRILDLGCGYGRDSYYLANNLDCRVTGIDASQKAIEIAKLTMVDVKNVNFRCCDFVQIIEEKFDIVLASNLYQVLKLKQREALRLKILELTKPGSMLFLNNLSVNDPEEYGKGERCLDEPHSFQNEKFLHFCTKIELETDFQFLDIKELYEHDFNEQRAHGKDHHHISWVLICTAKNIT